MIKKIVYLIVLVLMSLCVIENVRVAVLNKAVYPVLYVHAEKSNNLMSHIKCGQIKLAAKQYDEARDIFVSIIKKAVGRENERHRVLAYFYLGNVFYELEDYDNALKAYTYVLQKDAGNRKALKKFSRIMMAMGQYVDLYPYVSAYIKAKPRDSFGYSERCAILTRLEKYSYARKACEMAIKLRKSDARAHYDYAVLYEKQGFKDLAEDEYALAKGNQRNIKSREELEEMLNIKIPEPVETFGF